MKYYVDCNLFTSAENAAQYIIDNMSDDIFDDMLDENFNEIEICGYTYYPSFALRNIDETAYVCYKCDYFNSLYDEILDEMELLYNDSTVIYGFDVQVEEEEEEV